MSSRSGGGSRRPEGKHIEASALLAHAQMLESRLQKNEIEFGHPKPPDLYMCRIMDPDRRGADLGVVAMMAVTNRCISAQLLRESTTFKALGAPVEVLVLSGEDKISCATILSLELHHLTASDALIVPDRSQSDPDAPAMSLMSGGVKAVAPSPRVAIVAGTSQSRVISIEFSVKVKSMQLVRRNFFKGKEVCTYFEPLPSDTLTESQQKRGHAPPIKQSSSRVAEQSEEDKNNTKPGPLVPFNATGGVTTIRPYTIMDDGNQITHVWISFGDGTGVRFHHAGLFASVIQKHTQDQPTEAMLEDVLEDNLVKWEAKLPPMADTRMTVIPIPKYHPSPFAPFPTWKKPEFDKIVDPTADPRSDFREFHEAILYCSGVMASSFPTIAFYTSEDQFEGRIQGDDDEIEEKKSDGALTAIIGGLWGMLGGSTEPQEEEKAEQAIHSNEPERWDQNVPFPSINYEPISLFAGYEIHDHPRQITSCTIDPDGDLAAVTDTLGRVSLLDLSTKQVVRMWKGYRDTTCHWIQIPQTLAKPGAKEKPTSKRKSLHLAIHSRQRKVIEIWKMRNGPKIKTIQVSREAQLISCREISPVGFLASVYLAHSNVPFSQMNQIERIQFTPDASVDLENPERNRQLKRPEFSMVSQDAASRLNRLQQLLGETNVDCQTIDVFKALENIKSIEDLAKALDLLAASPTLETKMGVDGASFQQLAVSHCKTKLDGAMQEAGNKAFTNPHVQLLAFKIAYYTQIVKAYDVLHKYETSEVGDSSMEVVAPSAWGMEALGWTSTYEKITKRSIDDDAVTPPSDPMKFSAFASACVPPKNWMEAVFEVEAGGYEVFLSDSSKTRKEVLVRIFQPLLGDVFSFNALNQIFDALGIRKRHDYLLKCFGEWFTTLSVKNITKKAIFAKKSPANRWLETIVKEQMNPNSPSEQSPMESLYQFCRAEEELVRAFWLATLCCQSVKHAAADKEEQSYGKVSSEEIVGRWDDLLRQLRVCLLVSLRLYGIQLGACPLSVEAVESGDNFSVFEWLARDELAMSQKHDEIVTLENACRMSSHSFDPSTAEGDDPARVKILQNSCLSAAISEEQRAEYLMDFDDDERLGALLLYLKPHNQADVLVAHRALLLASKWSREPSQLSILEDVLVALKAVDVGEYKKLAYALRIEVWHICVRPVFRAVIMGFDDVQEIAAAVYAPLFHHAGWMKKFSEMALGLLGMISEIRWHDDERMNAFDAMVETKGVNYTWPALDDCFLLRRLVKKCRQVPNSSLEAHQILIYAVRLSRDISALPGCIPSFYDLFTTGALFNKAIETADMEEKQHEFMQDKILAFAQEYSGPSLDALNLGDIEILAELWDFDMDNVRTLFLLSMYEFGKDRFVDEIVTKSAASISVQHFCEDGVEIICRRLNYLLHVNPSEEIRDIMGTLDADMCEWIREKAENSEALVDGKLDVQVGNSHLFGLRLLSLAASAEISKDDRIKIHSLIVLSGTIVKALDEASSPAEDVVIPDAPVAADSILDDADDVASEGASRSVGVDEKDSGGDDIMNGSGIIDLTTSASDGATSPQDASVASSDRGLLDGASVGSKEAAIPADSEGDSASAMDESGSAQDSPTKML